MIRLASKKFLHLLARQDERSAPGDRTPLVRAVALDLVEPDEIREKLGQIACGKLFLMTSGYFEDDKSVLLSVSGDSSDALRLRARILAQKVLQHPENTQQAGVELMLAFEHPPQDLERITALDLRTAA